MADDMLKFPYINSKGFGTIPKLVMQDRELGVIAKAVYAYLCSYAGGGNRCFPSREKLCYDLNISKNCLNKYMKQLADRGYIKVTQVTDHGKFSHNTYEILSEINIKAEDTEAEEPEYIYYNPVPEANCRCIPKPLVEDKPKESEKKLEKKKSTRFVPPTLNEITEYAKATGVSTVYVEPFYDFYQSNGWKVGKNAMKDWRAALRNWARRNNEKGGKPNAEQPEGYKGFVPSKGVKR